MICPNCVSEMKIKKFKRGYWFKESRFKCVECGYETSKSEIRDEELEYIKEKINNNNNGCTGYNDNIYTGLQQDC